MSASGPLQIDLQKIVTERVPGRVPRCLVSLMEKLIRQRELNGILARTYPARGVEFASAALRDLDISVETRGLENIPEQGRFIFASNHPLGGLDGITLISVLGSRYGDDGIRFPVNDLLMNVEPLRGIFIPINKFGAQGRQAARGLQEAFASEAQLLYFPAGLVSRLGRGGRIADLQWHKAFVAKAIEHDRDIIPVYFSGRNSMLFYKLAKWRRRLGIRFNFEQILLPSELVKSRGSRYTITFGTPVRCSDMRASGKSPLLLAEQIKQSAYALDA